MIDVENELAKLRFQIKTLGDAIDHKEHPIAWLVVSLNWSEADLDRAEEIFDEYDKMKECRITYLERDLKEAFGITYQTVKVIVLAFWRNNQFVGVCEAYAEDQRVSEFDEILRSKNR